MATFELKQKGESTWRRVSEIQLMHDLADSYDRVTPAIVRLFEGKEISTSKGVYRLEKSP